MLPSGRSTTRGNPQCDFVLVAIGVSLFVLAHQAGAWWFRRGFRPDLPTPSIQTLSIAAVTTSLLGVAGIALIALDRTVLSGINNVGYAELLRCAPGLIDLIEIKRTPLLYVGYLTFSFGFASLVLFLLKGEEIREALRFSRSCRLSLPSAMRCSIPDGCRSCLSSS